MHVHFVASAQQAAQVLVFGLHDVFGSKSGDRHVVEGNSWTGLQHAQVLEGLLPDLVEVLGRVLVLGGLHREVQLAVRLVGVVESVCFGNVSIELLPHGYARLVSPQPGHIVHGVASAAEEHERHSIGHHFLYAFSVAFDAEVESAEDVVGDAVSAELQDHCAGHELGHHLVHHCLEEFLVGVVVDAHFERHIDRVVLALPFSHRVDAASAREEIVAVLVEGDSHDSVSEVEGFFYAVAVMHVDIKIQDAGIVLQQLEDGQHDVVRVAEPTRLALLGVVQSSSPIHCNACIAAQQQLGRVDGPSAGKLAELIQSCEAGTVSGFVHGELAFEFVGVDEELAFLFRLEHHVVGVGEAVTGEHVLADVVFEVVDVLWVMEAQQLLLVCLARAIDVELAVDVEAFDQRVSHRHALRLHGVVLVIVELADLLVVEVGHIAPLHYYSQLLQIQLLQITPNSISHRFMF